MRCPQTLPAHGAGETPRGDLLSRLLNDPVNEVRQLARERLPKDDKDGLGA